MNLREWKDLQLVHHRLKVKTALREGVESSSASLFSDEEIQEIKEELEIEQFFEEVEVSDGEEIELTDADEDDDSVQEVTEFEPDNLGETFDVEVEFDTELFEVTDEKLDQIRQILFAENFVVIEEGSKASVVFSKSKGKITKKKKCGPGMRLKGNRCIPQTGSQKAKNRMTGIKIKRAKKALGAKNKKAALRAKITKKRVKNRARNFAGMK